MEKIALLLMTSILAASSWTGLPGLDHIRELVKPSKQRHPVDAPYGCPRSGPL